MSLWGALLSVTTGIAILTLVAFDVFLTVLHHWGRSGPIGRETTHAIWRAALRATEHLDQGNRRRWLGLVGPMLIPVIVMLWALLLVLGYSFLYLPGIPEGFDRWDRQLPVNGAFADAFYFSGYTFFTLGYGDIAPVSNILRVVAIVQSGAGFALITLVIGYFVSVYDAYTHKTVLSQSIHYQAGNRADAAMLICHELAGGGSVAILLGTVGRLRDGLVRLRANYSNYPILHFFRDPEPSQSFLRLLFIAQDITLILDAAVDAEERKELANLGHRSGLAAAASAAQGALVKSMLRQVPEELRRESPDRFPGEQEWGEHCRRALRMLREYGIPTRPESEAVRDYCEGRREWEPLLRASADALGESWEEVTGEWRDP